MFFRNLERPFWGGCRVFNLYFNPLPIITLLIFNWVYRSQLTSENSKKKFRKIYQVIGSQKMWKLSSAMARHWSKPDKTSGPWPSQAFENKYIQILTICYVYPDRYTFFPKKQGKNPVCGGNFSTKILFFRKNWVDHELVENILQSVVTSFCLKNLNLTRRLDFCHLAAIHNLIAFYDA